jgi:hypothetical protein
MKTTQFLGQTCVILENDQLGLLVTQSIGPRISALRLPGGNNLLAELPDFTVTRPDGNVYRFLGGHRLWHAPEAMPRTYALDDQPVEIRPIPHGLAVTQPTEAETGIQKSMLITLTPGKPQVILSHTLTNAGPWPVTCAVWAITQLKLGGLAILPQAQEPTGLLPNRSLVIWPYTDLQSPHLLWGNRYLRLKAEVPGPFKVGYPNPRGWLAYWLEGSLFVKQAAYDPQAEYYDYNSSSQVYCNQHFIELETLGPVSTLLPGASITHTETWDVHANIPYPDSEDAVQTIADQLGLK